MGRIWENMKQKLTVIENNVWCLKLHMFENKEKSLYSKVQKVNWSRYFTNIVSIPANRHYQLRPSTHPISGAWGPCLIPIQNNIFASH